VCVCVCVCVCVFCHLFADHATSVLFMILNLLPEYAVCCVCEGEGGREGGTREREREREFSSLWKLDGSGGKKEIASGRGGKARENRGVEEEERGQWAGRGEKLGRVNVPEHSCRRTDPTKAICSPLLQSD
jgi:hypothetical protein